VKEHTDKAREEYLARRVYEEVFRNYDSSSCMVFSIRDGLLEQLCFSGSVVRYWINGSNHDELTCIGEAICINDSDDITFLFMSGRQCDEISKWNELPDFEIEEPGEVRNKVVSKKDKNAPSESEHRWGYRTKQKQDDDD
jgi:hypothetical protein